MAQFYHQMGVCHVLLQKSLIMIILLSNCDSIVMQDRASLGTRVFWTIFHESVKDSVMQSLHGCILLSSILAADDML